MVPPLSHGRALGLVVAMRTASVFSVIGSAFIISTFVYFPLYRKPINRLVFFATFGNLLSNVATLMSTAVLPKNSLPPSGLCELQGTLIQWFMMADSFWVLCMATNVFLVFFYGYDAQALRHMEKWYFAFSYGIPGVPALTYLILGRTGQQIIGSATLWCWVKTDVDWMRIAFFYAPVWIVITTTIAIYSITGYRIHKKRSELRSISRISHQPSAMRRSYVTRENTPNPFTVTNNIVVTTQIECDVQPQGRCVSLELDTESISSFSSNRMLSQANNIDDLDAETHAAPSIAPMPKVRLQDAEAQHMQHSDGVRRNGYRATVIAMNTGSEPTEIPTVLSKNRPATKRTAEGHAAAIAYFQVAFLFFVAMLVVWLPSSINRMYQFVHKGSPSYALNLISAIVLPLQGAWNAALYIFTTRKECRRAWGVVVSRLNGRPPPSHSRYGEYRTKTMTSSRETEDSETEIALETMPKQQVQMRHSEVSSLDAGDNSEVHRNREPR